MPSFFLQATEQALAAHEDAFSALAEEASWAAAEGNAAEVAARMRGAAKLCAQHDRHEAAAGLLTLAVRRCPVPAEDAAAVERADINQELSAAGRSALEAARLLMVGGECRSAPWPLTLLALAKAGGDEGTAARLAVVSQQPESVVMSRPFDEDATPKAVKGNALLAAAAAGDGEGVAAALASGADASAAAENGVTPLMLAARAASLRAVRQLLGKEADAKAHSRKSSTALGLAAEAGAADVCEALLTGGGAEVDTRDDRGLTPLISAAQGGCLQVVEVLLAKGAQMELWGTPEEAPRAH